MLPQRRDNNTNLDLTYTHGTSLGVLISCRRSFLSYSWRQMESCIFPPRLVNGVFNSPCHGLRNSLQLQALQKWLSPPLHLLNVRGFLTCPSVGVKGPVPDPGVCVRNILQWAVMVSVLALILSHFLLLGKFLLSFEFAYALELIISFSTYLYVPIRRGPLPISWVCQVAEVSHRYLEKLELLCDGH